MMDLQRKFPTAAAALELQDAFRRLAQHLRPGDAFLQDDLIQEMSLAVLLCAGEHKATYFITRALWRAKDFLRHLEAQHAADRDSRSQRILAQPPDELIAEALELCA